MFAQRPPSEIVNLLHLGIRTLEERDVLLQPGPGTGVGDEIGDVLVLHGVEARDVVGEGRRLQDAERLRRHDQAWQTQSRQGGTSERSQGKKKAHARLWWCHLHLGAARTSACGFGLNALPEPRSFCPPAQGLETRSIRGRWRWLSNVRRRKGFRARRQAGLRR